MKKLLVLLMALCMIFPLTACAQLEARKNLVDAQNEFNDAVDGGDIDDMTDTFDNFADKAVDAGETTDLDAETAVDILVNSDEWEAQMESIKEQGLTCELEARDNYMAYVYKYSIDIPDPNAVKANLDASKDSLKSFADSIMKVYTGIDGIIFEYCAKDGSVIATYTFQ